MLAFNMIQEFSAFENTTFLALFATQAHPVGLLSSELACWLCRETVAQSMGFIPLISHVVFVLVFIEHHPRQVWLKRGRWELPLRYTGWDLQVLITLRSLTMQSNDSASSLTSLCLLQPGILWVPFLGGLHWCQMVTFFAVRFYLVAHLLLPCMIWAALALSSAVADRQSMKLEKSKEVGKSHVWCWMNKLTGGHKGLVKLMTRSPVLLWVRVL